MTKYILIGITNDLPNHCVIDIFETRPIDSNIEIFRKLLGFDDLTILYSAEFEGQAYSSRFNTYGYDSTTTDLLSIGGNYSSGFLDINFEKNRSKINRNIYKISQKEALNIVIDQYHTNWFSSFPKVQELVVKRLENIEHAKKNYQESVQIERQYLSNYQNQYDLINNEWEFFWDSKYEQFWRYVFTNKFPVRNESFFFSERNRIQFNKQKKDYVAHLCNLTESWRSETKALPIYLNMNCMRCNKVNKISMSFSYQRTRKIFGGENSNFRNNKLIPGRKFYWANLSYIKNRQCLNCQNNVFFHDLYISNTFANSNKCSIYPYDDKDAWYGWCGVWMTIFEAKCHEYEYKDADGYGFFDKYNKTFNV